MKKAQGVTWKRAGGPPCEKDLAGTLKCRDLILMRLQ
jgi:hypothetical protein